MAWTVNPVQPAQKKRGEDSPRNTGQNQTTVNFSSVLEDVSQSVIQQRKDWQDGFSRAAPAKRAAADNEMELNALIRRIGVVNNQMTLLMGEAADG